MNSSMKGNGCEQEEKGAQSGLAARLLKQRTVILSGEINRKSGQQIIEQLLLLAAEEPGKPINLYINSPGGDADVGFAMFDVIRYVQAPVRVIVTGLAASAGVIVLLAAPRERRLSMPNARFLIHQPSTGVHGDVSDIQIEASEILKCRAKINKLIAEETNQKPEKVEADTKRNYWMGAQEAVEYGLVGRIVTNTKDVEEA